MVNIHYCLDLHYQESVQSVDLCALDSNTYGTFRYRACEKCFFTDPFMRLLYMLCVLLTVCTSAVLADDPQIPYSIINTPVVHYGDYHILSRGETFVTLDAGKGMSIAMLGHRSMNTERIASGDAVLTNGRIAATIAGNGRLLDIDQTNDPAARLMIIDQGPGRVAARTFFTMCDKEGKPYGSGTLDLYVYSGSVFLIPSVYIDYTKDMTVISKAGFHADVPGKDAELIVKGSKLLPSDTARFVGYGEETEGFNTTLNNPGRPTVKFGWLRNRYPSWMYMKNIAENPETDELYERWPHWITQRGAPLGWKQVARSGLSAVYEDRRLGRLEFLWTNGDSLAVPDGGYRALNGVMGLFLGADPTRVRTLWDAHKAPKPPDITKGEFKYYNEFEGVYEIDSRGGDVDCTIDNLAGSLPRTVFVRIWNLAGKSGWDLKANGKAVPFTLLNDGDILEDPMVYIVKEATGPARFATVALTVKPKTRTRLTLTEKPGIQLAYQMYSELETYEAWNTNCNNTPLFRFHLTKGEVYNGTLPGNDRYAFFKLPLYWLKNGINTNTFMNFTRGFSIEQNGPDRLRFQYTGVNLQGTGLSSYTVTVPYERDNLRFEVDAEFKALDDGVRWSSVEYCDLYPFEHVYRRDFHYDDVIFLNTSGEFDRVGTGAWGGGFDTVEEPEHLGYHAEPGKREGPGTRTPESADGTIWILGNNTDRGNIIYCRGGWVPSPGARSVFSLCNAWVDIHNTVIGRQPSVVSETISYSVEVFAGPVPSLENLNAMYRKAAGSKEVKHVKTVNFSLDGEIVGFEVE